MFITNRWAEVNRSHAWLAEDQQAWHFVEQRLLVPWLHITVRRERGEDACVEVFFLEDIRALEQFTRMAVEGAVELSLQIVTPGWMNGNGGWSMEPLEAIHESEDGLHRCYTVQSGRHYCQPNSTDCQRHCSFRELYRRK